jgi:hypothetical protein
MKTIIKISVFFLFSFFFSLNSNAQVVSGMNYQAVIRNSSNALVANATVGVKISILQGSASGAIVFSESHTTTTNANGLATFVIGTGTPLLGTFFTIDWLSGLHFIKTDTDPTGGVNYTISNTSQLNTVPYSQFAENSLYASYSGDSWRKTGNVVDLTTDFIGSVNDVDVVFKRNNIKAGAIANNDNISFGVNTLSIINTTASNNSAFGARALNNNISGFNNTAIGTNALRSNNADFNTAVGVASSFANTSGTSNTSMGHFSLKSNIIGSGNVSVGNNSLENSVGFYNTALGYRSLSYTTGDQNVALGWRALENLTTGGGNIGIGKIVDVPSPTSNNQLSIGNVIYGTNMGTTATGTIGIGVPVPTERLEVDGKTKTTNLQVTAGAGANKVLTSDAVGNATWQTSNANTGIHIVKTTNQIIVPNILTKIDFTTEETDDANAFNPTTDEWTIPSTGFYHINVSSRFNPALPVNYQATLHLYVNGVSTKFKGHLSNGSIYQNFDFSTDVKLNANDIVTVRIVQNTLSGIGGANATLSGFGGEGTFFVSGYKIY